MLSAERSAQARVLGGDATAVELLAIVRQIMLRALEAEAFSGPVLSTSQQLIDYLRADMTHSSIERFRVLYLNAQNRLLSESVVEGSISHAPIYPREIVRRALEVGATALILAHNHPSGDPTPSQSDIDATLNVIKAASTFDIFIHDHVIVARSGWTSFKALGLLR